MPVYNPYTRTSDMPTNTDYPILVEYSPNDPRFRTNPQKQIEWKETFNKYIADVEAWRKKYNIPNEVWQEWVNANQEKQKDQNFWDKLREKYQAAASTVKTAVQNVGETIKEGASNLKDEAEIVKLMLLFGALAPAAIIFLKRKGVTPSTKPRALVAQVYNEISRKNFGYSGGSDVLDLVGEKNTGVFESYGLVADAAAELITPEMIQTVIGFLKSIIDAIKSKIAKGQPLTDSEKELAGQITKIESELSDAKAEVESQETKIFGINWKYALAIVLLIVLFFVFKGKLLK